MHRWPLRAVAFDALETCLSLEPLRPELVGLGLGPADLELWFAQALRDAFACEAAARYRPFSKVLKGALAALLAERGLPADDARLAAVVEGFAALPAHADVRPALERARAAGLRVGVLTNGSKRATTQALERAGLLPLVHAVLSVEEVGHFKPARSVYHFAARRLGTRPEHVALVSAHGWDVFGAAEAGLATGFVVRREPAPSRALRAPDAQGASLGAVLEALGVGVAPPAASAPPPQRRVLVRVAQAAAVGLAGVGLARVLR